MLKSQYYSNLSVIYDNHLTSTTIIVKPLSCKNPSALCIYSNYIIYIYIFIGMWCICIYNHIDSSSTMVWCCFGPWVGGLCWDALGAVKRVPISPSSRDSWFQNSTSFKPCLHTKQYSMQYSVHIWIHQPESSLAHIARGNTRSPAHPTRLCDFWVILERFHFFLFWKEGTSVLPRVFYSQHLNNPRGLWDQ